MSILIKGMDMPYSCKQCNMFNLIKDINVFRCGANNEYYEADFDYHNIRHPDCPLIEVPTPHGRLIDAERLFNIFEPITSFPEDEQIMYFTENAVLCFVRRL